MAGQEGNEKEEIRYVATVMLCGFGGEEGYSWPRVFWLLSRI